MSTSLRTSWLVAFFLAAGLLFGNRAGIRAADDKPDAKKPDAKDSDAKADKPDAGKSDAAKADPFAVPDDKPEVVLKFIEKTEAARPTKVKTREELIDFYKNSRTAIIKASDKILAEKASDTTRHAAAKAKFNALNLLEQVGDPDASKQLKDFIAGLKDDKQPKVARLEKVFSFQLRMREVAGDPAAAAKFWDEMKAELNSAPDNTDLLLFAGSFASSLDHMNPDLAGPALADLLKIAAKNDDPEVAKMVKRLEGIARRLTLLGKPMEIKGTLLDGSPFDQGTLKGKVVLVDFWATWCGPCRAELPNVKENYEKYHDKGFEVVGVSLDQSADALEKFIADQKITWPILFPKDPKDQYWSNPLAVYYGVNGIPCAILTNQKGEVVSLNARGPELTNKLAELLGGDDKKTAEKPKDADKRKDAALK